MVFLGVIFHWLGGLASGSFYVPYKGVRKWSWETYWLVGGIFSWIFAPWIFATLITHDVVGVLSRQSLSTLGLTYFFGVLWGFGGLTFGLTMRYLGMSLGMGVALGYCAAFGTLIPPIAKTLFPGLDIGVSMGEIISSTPGLVTLGGIFLCLVGIFIAALAGWTKEREMPEAQKHEAIKEFNFKKGIVVATFSGIMSACFAFGIAAGKPISDASIAAGTPELWAGLPKLIVVMLGGLTTNLVWCVILNIRNGSGYQYFSSKILPEHLDKTASDKSLDVPLGRNYFFSGLAGVVWYLQFFFYTMGESQMGNFGFASWTLHMASIIIFSTLWGWYFHEWKGSSRKAHALISAGIATLILSTIVVGVGTWMKTILPTP